MLTLTLLTQLTPARCKPTCAYAPARREPCTGMTSEMRWTCLTRPLTEEEELLLDWDCGGRTCVGGF